MVSLVTYTAFYISFSYLYDSFYIPRIKTLFKLNVCDGPRHNLKLFISIPRFIFNVLLRFFVCFTKKKKKIIYDQLLSHYKFSVRYYYLKISGLCHFYYGCHLMESTLYRSYQDVNSTTGIMWWRK